MANLITTEMDTRGIVFELQWKKKQGTICKQEDFASLGIWDTADSSLDWATFKSYLSQNLGTFEDITVAYMDSDGDELPIESECEFQEALKFARQRARRGRKIVLKVDHPSPTPVVELGERKRLWKLPKHTKHGKEVKSDGSDDSVDDKLKTTREILTCELEELQKHNKFLVEKLESMPKFEELHKKRIVEMDEVPPPWFKKYMQKMQSEIIMEVTANTKQLLANMALSSPSLPAERNRRELVTSRNKKWISDEDSSDATLGNDQRDHRLLRKIEKLHKREKKLEKKLDSKLEKLENKTKRMMEKKSQSKPRPEWVRTRKIPRKRSSDNQVGTYLMDAIVLNDGPKSETHIKIGKSFIKIWEVMNTGTLPWTDKTEVRLAWGTLGLEPEEPYIKCPILEPGEKGQIAVNFRAPDFSGTFESYWHFYHMGERFGHWIGCAVVIEEPDKCGKQGFTVGENFEVEQKHCLGASNKPSYSKQEQFGNCEKLDNIDSLKNDELLSNQNEKSNDASINENLNNIEVESHMLKVDIAVDSSMKLKSEQKSDAVFSHPNKNNINETSTPGLVVETMKNRDPEYVSDSDDDNLSIISAPGLSSDSEDEKFVIVPMPACFMRDVPLGSENIPVIVKDNSSRHSVHANECSNTVGSELPSEGSKKNENATTENVVEDDIDYSSVTSHEAGERWWDSEDFKSNVYAVDAEGSCVPLETAWPATETTRIPLGYAAKPYGSPKHHQSDMDNEGPRGTKPKHVSPNKTTHTFSHTFKAFSQSSNHMYHPFPQPSCYSPSTQCAPPPTSTTSGTSEQAKDKTQSTSPPQMGNENAVHILPETIVNGAINVASSAYSTARAVISNLRSLPTGTPGVGLPREEPPRGEMSTTESLKLLYDMGFRNGNLNVLLLQRFDNDIAKVVAELLRGNAQENF